MLRQPPRAAPRAWHDPLVRLTCLSLGVLLAVWLHDALDARSLRIERVAQQSPTRTIIRAASPAPVIKAAETPAAVTRKAAPEVLPLKAETPKPLPRTAPEPAVATPPAASEPAPPVPSTVSGEPLPTLSAPQPYAPPPTDVATLPRIDTTDRPAVPGERPPAPAEPIRAFNDAPGGSVLVLGLLVNDRGTVVDVRILVPSNRPMEDLTFAFAVRSQRWTDITPPLVPGETRWLELRVPYATAEKAAGDSPAIP